MEEVEVEFALQKRTFLIPIEDQMYYQQRARREKRSVSQVVSNLLTQKLV
jgi:predicted CopG family antitoxin